MNITELEQGQINNVAGGMQDHRLPASIEEAMHMAVSTFIQENQIFRDHETLLCINIANTAYGAVLCLPIIKPLICTHELWEALQALPKEMPKC